LSRDRLAAHLRDSGYGTLVNPWEADVSESRLFDMLLCFLLMQSLLEPLSTCTITHHLHLLSRILALRCLAVNGVPPQPMCVAILKPRDARKTSRKDTHRHADFMKHLPDAC
jgi:hypothetical protein